MALVTITLAAISLLITARSGIPYDQNRIFGFQIHRLMISITILAIPAWTLLGTLLALVYKLFLWNNPIFEIGDPQAVFFVIVLSLSVILTSIVIYSNMRFYKSLIIFMIAICIIFGLLMPAIIELGTN